MAAWIRWSYDWTSAPATDYPTTIQNTSGLVGYWRLGEASGTVAADSSGNGRDGTNTGATVGAPGLLTGDANTAYSFDGVNDSVNLGANAATNITTGTLIAWIKTSSPGTSDRSVVKKGGAYGIELNGGVMSWYDPGINNYRSTGVNVADGNRHMLVFAFQLGVTNGTTFFIDGSLVLVTTVSLGNQDLPLSIGQSGASDQYFNGVIDEAALYNVVLTPAAIANLYTKGTTVTGGASHPITGSIAGTATVAGTGISESQPLTGSVAGSATIAATRIIEAQPLAGSVAGSATIAATRIIEAQPLAGSVTSGATIAAAGLSLAHPLTGSVTGTATITAALSGAPSLHALTGAVAGTSTITASQISEAQPLTGSVTGQASVTVARLVMDHALVGLVPGMASVTGLITMAQPLAGAITGVATISGQIPGPVVSYPWPATVTVTAVGGPAVSLTAITSPSGQPGAIADAPAVSLSAISVLTVTLAGVSDGPATALSSIAGSTATFANIAPPDGAWTAIADPVDISGVVPGPDATFTSITTPTATFAAVPVPSGTGSLIIEPTASVAAISDGPAITPVVYTMPEG